jgi:GNAT superfamily N-acetyltransferase
VSIELRYSRSRTDVTAVADLHLISRKSAYRSFLPPADLDSDPDVVRAGWLARVDAERHTHRLLLAERAGELLGFAYYGPDIEGPEQPDPGIAMLNALHVAPAAIGSGVGRLLMKRVLADLAGDGVRTARLWVLVDNRRAREFYRRGGWLPDGVIRRSTIGAAPTEQLRYVRAVTPQDRTEQDGTEQDGTTRDRMAQDGAA